ncbi:unnamed protein product [Caenorhabditis auriculariae]|uniref:MAM domain-containing protein n=1 Tax=Caenorhabditis auriculariae TaxID=2777116 RepID=A0A8S1HXG0_9PELO|nr:unnamed protein product [Caenorhabditis auriculariae]
MFLKSLTFLAILQTGWCLRSPLDCDFSGDCCWASSRDADLWNVFSADELDVNEFRRTFLVGKSHPPPRGNYAMRVEGDRRSSLVSCTMCSSQADVIVKFRHWQNAEATLKLCWQNEGDASPAPANCAVAKHAKQSSYNSYRLQVPSNQNIRLLFVVENASPGVANAVVIIDKVAVQFSKCKDVILTAQQQVSASRRSSSNGSSKKKVKASKRLARKNELARTTQNDKERRAYLEDVDKLIAKTVDQVDQQNLSTSTRKPKTDEVKKTAAPLVAALPPRPASPENPLTDLLGKDLVNFLDPNFVSADDDEPEEEDEELIETKEQKPLPTPMMPKLPMKEIVRESKKVRTSTKVVIPIVRPKLREASEPETVTPKIEGIARFLRRGRPLAVSPTHPLEQRLPSLSVPSSCETLGGCLFERSLCHWTAPASVAPQHRFHIQKVGLSSFAQSMVPSGQVSAMETPTLMSEPHLVLFDALEFRLGTRLVGCCSSASGVTCPFATSSEETPVVWQFSKFECAAGTIAIAFVCENLGVSDGICGVDNVRIHRSSDVLLLEPCQKNTLSSI